MSKKALITGHRRTGRILSHRIAFVQGYEVHGIVRRVAIEDTEHKLRNIGHLLGRIVLHAGSLDNVLSLIKVIRDVKPDECYHLASSSFVSYSFDDEISIPEQQREQHALPSGGHQGVRTRCRFYFAGSSEMFGNVDHSPQNEGRLLTPDRSTVSPKSQASTSPRTTGRSTACLPPWNTL